MTAATFRQPKTEPKQEFQDLHMRCSGHRQEQQAFAPPELVEDRDWHHVMFQRHDAGQRLWV